MMALRNRHFVVFRYMKASEGGRRSSQLPLENYIASDKRRVHHCNTDQSFRGLCG